MKKDWGDSRAEGAEQFGREVDRLLNMAGRGNLTPHDVEGERDLAFAAELARVDFSRDSRRRLASRGRLIEAVAARKAPSTSAPHFWARASHLPRTVTVAAAALMLIAVMSMVQPGVVASIVQPVARAIRQLIVGKGTEARLVAKASQAFIDSVRAVGDLKKESGEAWVVWTGAENVGGRVPSGAAPYVRLYNSLHLAKEGASFPVRDPSWLPSGYRFLNAMIGPDDMTILIYFGPRDKVSITQVPLESKRGGNVVGSDEGGLSEATVNGKKAAWLDHALLWEDNQISYGVTSRELDLKTTTKIAESLR